MELASYRIRRFKKAYSELLKVCETLRSHKLYANPYALDLDNCGCQAIVTEAFRTDPTLKGALFWNDQAEIELGSNPVLYIGFRASFGNDLLEISRLIDETFHQHDLKTIWNGCICNAIGVILKDDYTLTDSMIRPCVCDRLLKAAGANAR